MKRSEINIDDLIKRYLRGQLNDDEYETLVELLKDTENQDLFQNAKLLWNKNPEPSELVLKNWNRTKYKIASSNVPSIPRINKTRVVYKTISYAAILILGLVLGTMVKYFLFDEVNTSNQEFVFETPRGEKSKVTLPDGSVVWLNAKSRLAYHSFNKVRKVELIGEAYFNVTHNKSKPFTVSTSKCDIEVLGTSFNVMAYEEFKRNEITLVEGSVKVSNSIQSKVLKPNHVLLVRDGQMKVSEIGSEQAIAWVDNKFNFTNIPLKELVQRLENWYDVDIQINGNINNDINFTGVFKNEETIWQVLDALKIYLPIDYQRTNMRKTELWIKE